MFALGAVVEALPALDALEPVSELPDPCAEELVAPVVVSGLLAAPVRGAVTAASGLRTAPVIGVRVPVSAAPTDVEVEAPALVCALLAAGAVEVPVSGAVLWDPT